MPRNARSNNNNIFQLAKIEASGNLKCKRGNINGRNKKKKRTHIEKKEEMGLNTTEAVSFLLIPK